MTDRPLLAGDGTLRGLRARRGAARRRPRTSRAGELVALIGVERRRQVHAAQDDRRAW